MSAPAPLSKHEFIALIAMLMATTAFSIDAMLPALPQIAEELTPSAPNRAQLVVTSFVLGMGIGTLFVGPISDAVGRKPVVICGAVLFSLAAAIAWVAPTLELLLAARVLQGLAGSAARVVALAIVRDRFSGRQMAQVVSLVIVVFSLVPAIAPTLGAGIMALTGWRGIFGAFLVFAAMAATWLALRLAETLAPEDRRPLKLRALRAAAAEVVSMPLVRTAVVVQALCFGMLFTMVSTTQPVFDLTFGLASQFHWWFGLVAILSASGGLLNARIVMRLGMRRVIRDALMMQIVISSLYLAALGSGVLAPPFAFIAYLFWTISVFFMAGLTLGNLNALALEPLGHIAGMAASLVSAGATVGAALLAAAIGQTFDGTPLPVAMGILLCAACGWLMMLRIGEGRPETAPGA